MLLGVGASKKKYIDDIFANYLYLGNDTSNRDIVNGIDLASKGGFVWTKNRDSGSYGNNVFDTVRGVGKMLRTDTNNAEAVEGNTLTTFNSNGFRINSDNNINKDNDDYVSYTFAEKKGFFDIVTYTGSGSAKTVAHSLGSVPGMVLIKRTDNTGHWIVHHRQLSSNAVYLALNENWVEGGTDYFNSTAPTSTHFSVKDQDNVNANGGTYVAYLFAGGESTAATARSIDFDGTNDSLTLASSSDFAYGTGDFTIEGWINLDANATTFILTDSTESQAFLYAAGQGTGKFNIIYASQAGGPTLNSGSSTNLLHIGQWYHVAVSRSSGTSRLFINGNLRASASDTQNYGNQALKIGERADGSDDLNGKISNLRIVKGTAVYTSSFKPPTEPLTNITNTKLLCCNNSSTTGSTVTPGTITANGDPTASTDSPFDDPASHSFGENRDENVIKTGSYIGNGSATGPEVYVGWEPQWILIKNISNSEGWRLFDSMRGMTHNDVDARLFPASADAESAAANFIDLTSTGFKIKDNGGAENGNGDKLVYVAIRRPDGYVGKPAELGTDVFALGTSNASSTTPCHVTNFVTDFAFVKTPASSSDWYTGARLIGEHDLRTNGTNTESNNTSYTWDSNTGFAKGNSNSWNHWGWKRHAGFDVVAYTGDGVTGREIPHSLSKTPEMIWLKCRSQAESWQVGHKDLNGGSTPWAYTLRLNDNIAEAETTNRFQSTAPTSRHFTVGDVGEVNSNNEQYIAMLFASVDGISKVGSYTGNASSSGPTITLGFAPRFIMLKGTTGGTEWYVLDTTRGLDSGDDKRLSLDSASSQDTGDYIDPSSTGFQVVTTWDQFNGNNQTFVYYAHA